MKVTVMFSFKLSYSFIAALCACYVLASCDQSNKSEAQSDAKLMTVGAGTPVPASGETEAVATQQADAADDPEIWVDPKDSSRAVIFGTDKKAGLYYYDLTGKILGFMPDGLLNNVDLRDGFAAPEGERVLIAASDRRRMGIALYLMDAETLTVKPWTLVGSDIIEPYGLCMGRRGEDFLIVLNGTDGQVRQVNIKVDADGLVTADEERRFALSSQTEGCVIDDAKGQLYIGEEAKGIWRYSLDPSTPATGTLIATAPSDMLKPDVEGLTILREGTATWLIASSQGDSAFAVWQIDGDAPVYRGRFSVVAAKGIDAVTGTDGVAALGGVIGNYPEGLVVMQDDVDTEGEQASTTRDRQNFKLVDWRDIKAALKLSSPQNP